MAQYLPLLAMLILAALFAGLSFVASRLLAPRRPTPAKEGPYECGIVPDQPAVDRFPVQFYLVVQVRPAIQVSPPEGGAARAVADPSKPPTSVILLRNLGAVRLHPAVFTIATTLAFALFCYQLHLRDREAAERREQEQSGPGPGRLQPVGR